MDGLLLFQGWLPTNPEMVTHQTRNGQPPEGGVLQTLNLILRLTSQNQHQVATAMDGHLPSSGWSPTLLGMILTLF